MDNVTARILLAERRGKTEFKGLHSYHVFNFGNYKLEGRETFGRLVAFNEDVLAPENSTQINIPAALEIILIPIAGGIEITLNDQAENIYLAAGECCTLCVAKGDIVKITNPYPSQTVSFIQTWLKADGGHLSSKPSYAKADFDISIKNTLLPLFTSVAGCTKAYIGKYDLRQKDILTIKEPIQNLFVYVIEGAFEFQDRLIQPKDGLRFENIKSDVDFQALSHDAILLVLQSGE